jgi:RND family efflux transporter MFP subunit
VEAAKAALSEATQAAGYAEVYAPFSGIVVSKLVELGETVSVGTPLMSGLSLHGLRAVVNVPQEHMAALREHRKARVILADGSSLSATDLRLPPNADPSTHTFKVLANLPDEEHGLFPGTLVKIAFVSGKQQQLLLPASALVHRGEVTGSYILDNDKHLSFRYVRVGSLTPAGNFPVLSGIDAGERVAIDPIAASRAYRGQGDGGSE